MRILNRNMSLALNILQQLALAEGRWVKARELSEALMESEFFIFRVIRPLMKQGILISKGGKEGGYRLSTKARDLTIRDILVAFDRTFQPSILDAKLASEQALKALGVKMEEIKVAEVIQLFPEKKERA